MEQNYILDVIKKHNKIRDNAKSIGIEHFKLTHGKFPRNFSPELVSFNEAIIGLKYSCCEDDYREEWYTFPISCLWNKNWKEDLLKEIEHQEELKKAADTQKTMEQEAAKEKKERELLATLLAKYGV